MDLKKYNAIICLSEKSSHRERVVQ